MDADLGQLEAKEGKVCCPGVDCKAPPFDPGMIMRHAPKAWPAYYAGQIRLKEHQLSKQIEAEVRKRLEDEQASIAKLDVQERELRKHHEHIAVSLIL